MLKCTKKYSNSMTKNKILITGVAGFIGSHLAERLIQNKYRITGIDNLSNIYPDSLYKYNLSLLTKYNNFCFSKLDILDRKVIDSLIKKVKPNFIVHCAAKTGIRESLLNPLSYTNTNIIGTQTILEAIRLYSPETKTIILSSSSVYGIQDKLPLTESMSPNPISPYGFSKYAMELLAQQYYNLFNLKIVIVRPFSIYGPRGRINMAPFIAIKSAETGLPFVKFGYNDDNKRDWTYIDDFTDGILKIINKNLFQSYEIFNLGNSKPIGIDDFVRLIKKMTKLYLNKKFQVIEKPRPKSDISITFAHINKAKKLFNYSPKINLAEGLKKLFEDYRKNRQIYKNYFISSKI